jgi:protoporphyrinogen oxidase
MDRVTYYVGDNVANTPEGASIVSLDHQAAPDIAVEIAKTSLLDDLGAKSRQRDQTAVGNWLIEQFGN